MARQVRDIMTVDPVVLPATATLEAAAQAMKGRDIGTVIVADNTGVLCGVVTDRDIVVRGMAEGRPGAHLGDLCSSALVTIAPDDDVTTALRLMSEHALRRLPVVEGGEPIGIISLGDAAVDRDGESVLGKISAAPPNA